MVIQIMTKERRSMLSMTARLYAYARLEIRSVRRLFRFWLIALLLTVLVQVSYAFSCIYLGYIAPYDPTLGAAAPKYLLGTIDPTYLLIFQWATLLLIFDVAHRHKRERIAEVLDKSPTTNFECFAARAIGIATLVWFVVAFNILVLQLVGSFSTFGWAFVETLQWHSLINLLFFDVPVNLLFWTSCIVLLEVVLRLRILIVAVSALLMFGWYWFLIQAPHSLLSFLSPSSNDTLFISEIQPVMLSIGQLLIRVAYVLVAGFFLGFAALISSRSEETKTQSSYQWMVPSLLVLACVVYAGGTWGLLSPYSTIEKWKQTHSEYTWVNHMDIQSITGTVEINPSRLLRTDLVLDFLNTSVQPTKKLVFSLNPGMKIERIEVNNRTASYDFSNGLLEVISQSPIEPDDLASLRVVAYGKPNPDFAYIDSSIDYRTSTEYPVNLARLLGTAGSIFDSNYVALMPGVCWYPRPGTNYSTYEDIQQGRDFFDVSLEVQLKPKNWQLVSSGAFEQKKNASNSYIVHATGAVPEIGLFASRFEHTSVVVGGVKVSAYLHRKHNANLKPLSDWSSTVRDEASSWVEQFAKNGLPIEQTAINIVEVPRGLRTVGGGWRMATVDTLPGLVLVKEHGYPRAKFSLAVKQYENSIFYARDDDEETQKIMPIKLLSKFLETGKGSDSPWMSLYKHQWGHWTAPNGDYAVIIDEVITALISSLHPSLNKSFSIYSTAQISNHATLDMTGASDGSYQAGARSRVWYEDHLARLEHSWTRRPSVWRYLERSGFTDLPTEYGHEHDLELVLLKCREIAISLLNVNKPEVVYSWLNAIRDQYRGQNFTYEQFIESAKDNDVVFHPFLTDWITGNALPAYIVHQRRIEQISNDERGNPRYQLSVTVQNTQPVAGQITLQIPTEETAPYFFSSYNYRIAGSGVIPSNTTKQFNIQLSYPVNSIGIYPGLSFNREPFYLYLEREELVLNPNLNPAPFEEVVANVIRTPELIVDNLDAGFSVDQDLRSLSSSSSFGPASWTGAFSSLSDNYDGLPFQVEGWYQVPEPSNIWRIWTSGAEVAPFGKYRQTTAYISATERIPDASFNTALPDMGTWQLEYFDPWTLYNEVPRRSSKENISLKISQGDTSFNVPLDKEVLEYGWNTMGKFELVAGEVHVAILFKPTKNKSEFTIFADAIRWTRVSAN